MKHGQHKDSSCIADHELSVDRVQILVVNFSLINIPRVRLIPHRVEREVLREDALNDLFDVAVG